ncbi:OmpA family protein [Chitinophaga sp. CF418]|uniref:OmpA family protein n=1 Tax=Chitinophaga sp. CF418 TaxID=1855287 RepID=UPI000923FD20|nr:OmpA family protein [Chitinophaga sp. CF418]SHM06719.1 WD40-like Beta Propeller Repeat [Chitinophaga sp. CF418]
MKRVFLLMSSCFLLCLELNAQVITYENAKKKAQKTFDDAQMAVREYRMTDAIDLLKDAVRQEPGFTDAYGQMVITYAEMKQYKEAIINYETLKRLDSLSTRPAMLSYSKALAGEGRFSEALANVNLYIQTNKTKSARAEALQKAYTFAAKAAAKPVPFKPRNMGDSINTKDPEYFPSLTIDGKTLVFTRRVNSKNEDFYVSEKDDSLGWMPAYGFGSPVNTANNEGAQNISQDGNMLVFTGCDFPGGRGSCDIYYTIRTEEGLWVEPMNMGSPINTRDWESQPSLSADRQTLYFARETADAGSEIFMSKLQPNGKWGFPERLDSNINTPGRETTPFIHPDNQTLYFASNGHPGFGDMDIFFSRRQPDGSWGPAVNLGYPINTVDEDASLIVAADGKTAYFASDRSDSRGQLDIYTFELYPEARALRTLFVRGYVYDAKTKRRLVGNVELTDLETGKTAAVIRTDKIGNYLIPLPTGKDYAFNVNRKGYLFYSDNFSLKNKTDDSMFVRDIPLVPLDTSAVMVLYNIFFDTRQFNLKPGSEIELNRLVGLMQENSSLIVEISGHTDNIGNDKDNMILSERRAQAVVKYLVDKGIPAERLQAKGYGETQPVAENDTPGGRAANRRTEFKILKL